MRPAKHNESTHATRAEAAAWVLEANEEPNWQEDYSAKEAQGKEERGLVDRLKRPSRTIHETNGFCHDDEEAFETGAPCDLAVCWIIRSESRFCMIILYISQNRRTDRSRKPIRLYHYPRGSTRYYRICARLIRLIYSLHATD